MPTVINGYKILAGGQDVRWSTGPDTDCTIVFPDGDSAMSMVTCLRSAFPAEVFKVCPSAHLPNVPDDVLENINRTEQLLTKGE